MNAPVKQICSAHGPADLTGFQNYIKLLSAVGPSGGPLSNKDSGQRMPSQYNNTEATRYHCYSRGLKNKNRTAHDRAEPENCKVLERSNPVLFLHAIEIVENGKFHFFLIL